MPTINTAQQAVDIAERFIAKYYAFRTLKRAFRQGKNWVIIFDVGILASQNVRVTLNPSGKVVGYRGVR